MDPFSTLTQIAQLIPSLGPLIHSIFVAILGLSVVASFLTSELPAPVSGPWVKVWPWLNWLARNVKYAQNAAGAVPSEKKE